MPPESARRAWAVLVALCLLTNLPAALHESWLPLEALTLSGEVLVLVLLCRRLPGRAGPLVFGAVWAPLMVFELTRLIGEYLTNRDALLFDVFVLAGHVGVLLRDLYGAAGLLLPVALVALVALAGAAVGRAARPVLRGGPSDRVLLVLTGLAALGWFSPVPWPGRWTMRALVWNVGRSAELMAEAERLLSPDAYAEQDAVRLTRTPDVELYVIESYGRLLEEPELVEPWQDLLATTGARLEERGWHVASAWATAPVSGGRSWLSDATVMLGVDVAHEASWQHIRPQIHGVRHLPGFFAAQGYRTVVVRPKDQARPGIALRNDFGWTDTVFHDEIAYPGPGYGWGVTPDQYSLGRLHDVLLPAVPSPRFVFFHGVDSHGPWDALPPRVDDWRSLETGAGAGEAPPERGFAGTLERMARLHLGHSKRKKKPLGPYDVWAEPYLDAIVLSLDVTSDAVGAAPPDGPGRVVVLYGDHQPPLLGQQKSFDVPVHVAASDPALLQGFLDAGFTADMRPEGEPRLRLAGLYPLVASAVAAADGQVLPLYPSGAQVKED